MQLPMTPPAVPRNMFRILTTLPAESSATGVAQVTPSTLYCVMAFGNEMSRKQRAASAGLIKFFPRPPNAHFTTRIAKMPPRTGANSGVSAERVSASIRPVTSADPSRQVSGLRMSLSYRNSVPTELITEARMIQSAFRPWTMTPTAAAGSRVAATTYMMNAVDRLSLTCGPEERFRTVLISHLPPAPRACAP